jgi:Na+/H+ antiporter NhaD/arsenite permease-like protein
MNWPGPTELLWAALLLVLGAVGWVIFEETDYLSILLPSFAVVATVAFAAGSQLAARRQERRTVDEEVVTDVSWSTVLVSIALSLALFGLAVGTWLIYIGAGLFAFGAGGLLREWTAERRALRAAAERRPAR